MLHKFISLVVFTLVAYFTLQFYPLAKLLAKPENAINIAVTYFDNTSNDVRLSPLRKGLTDMLMTDLSVSEELRLVERKRLEELLTEIKLGDGPFIDSKTAQQMGKGLSADLIITGAFISMSPKMRIDARIVLVETGEVLYSTKVEGDQTDFFELEAQLATQLLNGLGTTLSPIARAKVQRSPTKSLDAMLLYSEGLDAADQGKNNEAKTAFSKALKLDPAFAAAQTRLDNLSIRMNKVEERIQTQEDLISAVSGGRSSQLSRTLDSAREGHSGAQFDLGIAYFWGSKSTLGTIVDYSAAKLWFEKSAAQKHPAAAYYLAKLAVANDGPTVKQEGEFLLKQSIEYGSPCRAQFAMGMLEQHQNKNSKEAIRWYKAAIKRTRSTAEMPNISSSLMADHPSNWDLCKSYMFGAMQAIGEILGTTSRDLSTLQDLAYEVTSPEDYKQLAAGKETPQIQWLRKIYDHPQSGGPMTNLALGERVSLFPRDEYSGRTSFSARASAAKAIRDLYRISPATHESSMQLLLWWDRALEAGCTECEGDIESVRRELEKCDQSWADGDVLHLCSVADLAPQKTRSLCEQSFSPTTKVFDECVEKNLSYGKLLSWLSNEVDGVNSTDKLNINGTDTGLSEVAAILMHVLDENPRLRNSWPQRLKTCREQWGPSEVLTLRCLFPDMGVLSDSTKCLEAARDKDGKSILRDAEAKRECQRSREQIQMVWDSKGAIEFCRKRYDLAQHGPILNCLAPRSPDRCRQAQKTFDDALNARDRNDMDLARELLESTVEVCPMSAPAHFSLALLWMSKEKPNTALEKIDTALLIDPIYFYALANRPVVLTRLGRLSEALEAYTDLLKHHSSHAVGWINRSKLYQRMGKYALAQADAEKSISIDPGIVNGHIHLGNSLMMQGEAIEGEKSFLRAARLGSHESQLYFQSMGHDWRKDVCKHRGLFTLDQSDDSRWLIKKIELEKHPAVITSFSVWISSQDASASISCDSTIELEGAILITNNQDNRPPASLKFHERFEVSNSLPVSSDSNAPVRLDVNLDKPLKVAKGQTLFIGYRRRPNTRGTTCFLACLDPYRLNREWVQLDDNKPITWKPISDTIEANLAICVNPDCTWPSQQ
jgi:tetratricopeptide (TPR) repeat protein